MKYMDIDCYERGCACASSSRVAGEDSEVVEVVRLREYQEPVAWMETYNGHPNNLDWNPDNLRSGDLNVPGDNVYEIVPLYTATRELSNEEIDRVVDETYGVPRNPGIYASHRRLARAILKKASEKCI